MSFLKLAEDRYCVRVLDPSKQVEEEKIDKILKAAQFAPTACNYQPQRIYVVKTPELLEKLKEASPYTFKAPIIFIVCSDMEKCWKHPNEEHLSGETDAAIVATQMILEAFEIGIGSTWVRMFDSAKIAEILKLPANIKPMVFLPMGYPAASAHPSKLHFNKKEYKEFTTFL